MSHDPWTAFPRALSGAMAASGMTLETISHLLAEQGLSVSIASLSYWATGRSLPTRAASLEAVRQLETILDVEPGVLVSALAMAVHDVWRPTAVLPGRVDLDALRGAGLDLDRHATSLLVHDALRAVPGGAQVATHTVLRAEEPLARLALLVAHPVGGPASPTVEVGPGLASVEEPVVVARGGHDLPLVWAVPVVLARRLAPGEAWQVETTTHWHVDGEVRGLARPTPATTRFLVQEAWVGDRSPVVRTTLHGDGATAGRRDPLTGPVPCGTDGHVVVASGESPSALHLLTW